MNVVLYTALALLPAAFFVAAGEGARALEPGRAPVPGASARVPPSPRGRRSSGSSRDLRRLGRDYSRIAESDLPRRAVRLQSVTPRLRRHPQCVLHRAGDPRTRAAPVRPRPAAGDRGDPGAARSHLVGGLRREVDLPGSAPGCEENVIWRRGRHVSPSPGRSGTVPVTAVRCATSQAFHLDGGSMKIPRQTRSAAAVVTVGRAGRRGGAGDLARGLLERPAGHRGQPVRRRQRRRASTRSSPTATSRPAGRYTIVGNLLPSDADGQRDQFVRRLAAKDAGMDLLGMDVTWTAEFAEAGWIRELTGDQKAAGATKDTLQPPIDTATWKDKLYGIPQHTNVQLLWYRKSLVPDAAEDVRRDDADGPAAQGPGQALRDRPHRGPVRGLRGEHQQPGHRLTAARSSTRTARRPRSTTRPCRR